MGHRGLRGCVLPFPGRHDLDSEHPFTSGRVHNVRPKHPLAALSLLGATALTAQAATARSQDVIAAATSTRPRYIFGYGSLIERESRIAAWPSAQFASPVIVKGVARGWFDQTDVPSWSPTYLGGIAEANAETNGVIFRVTAAEFDSYTQRETGYRPTQIDPSQITMLDGSSTAPDGDIWYFANARKDFPSDVHPIVQSYVDVCLDGCLEIEATYPRAKQANFAERFVRTTSNGDHHGSTTASILGGHSSTCRARGKSTR